MKNQSNVKFLAATCGDKPGQAGLSVIVFLAGWDGPHSPHDSMNVGVNREYVLIQAVHHDAEGRFRPHSGETGEIFVFRLSG